MSLTNAEEKCRKCVQQTNEALLKKALLLIPYIPYEIVKQAGKSACCFFQKRLLPFRGTILFADIVGFTPIVLSLIKEGSQGTEKLQEVLTDYYTELVETIRQFGASVYQFAGDSILVSFSMEANENAEQNISRAVKCTQDIIKKQTRFQEIKILNNKYNIYTSIGLSFGDYNQVLLGSRDLWCNFSIVGNTVEEAVRAKNQAEKGGVAVNRDLWNYISSVVKGEKQGNYYKIVSDMLSPYDYQKNFNLFEMLKNNKFYARCSALIKPLILEKITNRYQVFQGEHREITCLFLRFDGLNYDQDIIKNSRHLNDFYGFVQIEAARYGGLLLHTDFADKGNVFFILFGAPIAQEKKEILSIQLALNIMQEKTKFPFINTIQTGISTGKAYCGNFAAAIRKDYSVLGPVVNRAARLMTFSSKQTGIYIDEATELKINGRFLGKKIDNVSLKGIADSVTIYNIQSEIKHSNEPNTILKNKIIGRSKEYEQLLFLMKKSFQGNSHICTIIGEAGIGKTMLTNLLTDESNRFEAQSFKAFCFSYEQTTPFYPWRDLLFSFFKIKDFDEIKTAIKKITAKFTETFADENHEWIPVLAKSLGITANEYDITKNLDPQQKQHKLFAIIHTLLIKDSIKKPLLLIFEDIHCIDEISMLLIEYLANRIDNHRIMIILSSRNNRHFSRLNQLPNFSIIRLSQLPEKDARDLIRNKLNFSKPDTQLENQVIFASDNNPFYIETIIQSLIEQSQIIEDENQQRCLAANIDKISIPNSIQDMVLSRIDALKQDDQVVVKTASVIGKTFDSEMLGSLLPKKFTQNTLAGAMATLNEMGITFSEQNNPKQFFFKQTVIRDVVYETLLEKTREELNLILALYLEKKERNSPLNVAERLAYHFIRAKQFDKGLQYSIMSAAKAKDQNANHDAINHYKTALTILSMEGSEKQQDMVYDIKANLANAERLAGNYKKAEQLYLDCFSYWQDPNKKMDLYIGLGNVYQEIGEPVKAIKELEKGLRVLKRKTPGSLATTILALFGQLYYHSMYSLFPFFVRSIHEKERERYKKQATIFAILNKIYLFDIVEKIAWSSLAMLNIARRLKSAYHLSLANGDYAVALMGMGFLPKAFKHFTKSIELAKNYPSYPRLEAIALLRLGFYYTFSNQISDSVKVLIESISIFRRIGEMWELLTALGALGQAYFLMSDFEKSEQTYLELEGMANDLNSSIHLGWTYCKIPFCRYLSGKMNADTTIDHLNAAFSISEQANDMMNPCILYGHLANIAVRQGDYEEAAKLSVKIMHANSQYKVMVPHVKISFVDASEAALFALENKAVTVPKNKLLNIARLASQKALSLGKNYPYLKGPAHRAHARYLRFIGKEKKAVQELKKALTIMENSQNRWETGVTFFDASLIIPAQTKENLDRAREIFTTHHIKTELHRLELIYHLA